tara:strand:- start:64 stop:243 length:180 start_codon:yes stop_codon:yes gene_type:complete
MTGEALEGFGLEVPLTRRTVIILPAPVACESHGSRLELEIGWLKGLTAFGTGSRSDVPE